MKKKLLLSLVLPAAVIFTAPAFAGSDEAKVQWADVPAVVQKTIEKTMTDHAAGIMEEIEKETKIKGGKKIVIYEVSVRLPDGKKVEIEVHEDGRLMDFERD